MIQNEILRVHIFHVYSRGRNFSQEEKYMLRDDSEKSYTFDLYVHKLKYKF